MAGNGESACIVPPIRPSLHRSYSLWDEWTTDWVVHRFHFYPCWALWKASAQCEEIGNARILIIIINAQDTSNLHNKPSLVGSCRDLIIIDWCTMTTAVRIACRVGNLVYNFSAPSAPVSSSLSEDSTRVIMINTSTWVAKKTPAARAFFVPTLSIAPSSEFWRVNLGPWHYRSSRGSSHM